MDCTPDKCPHRELMEKARAACLACDHVNPSGHGGVKSVEAMGERILHREMMDFGRTPRGQVTLLPEDVEERIAEVFRRWCGLNTIDALLLLHVTNGGTCATFGKYLERVAEAIGKAGGGRENYRATAWAKFQSLMRRFRPFLKSSLKAWDDGHGGAIRREREACENAARQGDLFEAMGMHPPSPSRYSRRGDGFSPRGEVSPQNRVTFFHENRRVEDGEEGGKG